VRVGPPGVAENEPLQEDSVCTGAGDKPLELGPAVGKVPDHPGAGGPEKVGPGDGRERIRRVLVDRLEHRASAEAEAVGHDPCPLAFDGLDVLGLVEGSTHEQEPAARRGKPGALAQSFEKPVGEREEVRRWQNLGGDMDRECVRTRDSGRVLETPAVELREPAPGLVQDPDGLSQGLVVRLSANVPAEVVVEAAHLLAIVAPEALARAARHRDEAVEGEGGLLDEHIPRPAHVVAGVRADLAREEVVAALEDETHHVSDMGADPAAHERIAAGGVFGAGGPQAHGERASGQDHLGWHVGAEEADDRAASRLEALDAVVRRAAQVLADLAQDGLDHGPTCL
jgi:hypothetical protein